MSNKKTNFKFRTLDVVIKTNEGKFKLNTQDEPESSFSAAYSGDGSSFFGSSKTDMYLAGNVIVEGPLKVWQACIKYPMSLSQKRPHPPTNQQEVILPMDSNMRNQFHTYQDQPVANVILLFLLFMNINYNVWKLKLVL